MTIEWLARVACTASCVLVLLVLRNSSSRLSDGGKFSKIRN